MLAGSGLDEPSTTSRDGDATRGGVMDSRNTLILGIGNPLMTDDGIGVHVARLLATDPDRPADVKCLDGGTLGYLLVGEINATNNLIVVDAAQLDSPPGTVAVFENDDMDRFLNTHPNRSVHEVGLADLMTMALLSDRWPERRALIAVQPCDASWGTELSAEVAHSVPKLCEKTWGLLASWRA